MSADSGQTSDVHDLLKKDWEKKIHYSQDGESSEKARGLLFFSQFFF